MKIVKPENKDDSYPILHHIAVKTESNIKILKISNIVYLEAHGSSTIVYLQDKTKVIASKNLGYYENILKKEYFLKVHRSYIINIAFLETIFNDAGGQYCVLTGNYFIPISNRKLSFVKKFLHL